MIRMRISWEKLRGEQQELPVASGSPPAALENRGMSALLLFFSGAREHETALPAWCREGLSGSKCSFQQQLCSMLSL